MGRSRPTYRARIDHWRKEFEPFRRALHRHRGQQDAFDQCWIHARTFAPSGKLADTGDDKWNILFSMVVGQQIEINLLRQELRLDPSDDIDWTETDH